MISRRFAVFALAVFATLIDVSGAEAQRPRQQVLDLNRQGMEPYKNLEIEQAQRSSIARCRSRSDAE